MQATAIQNVVSVVNWYAIEGEHVFETDCADYDAYSVLPVAAELDGRVYVKTGWNSDVNRAYYKTGRPVAIGR